MNKSDVSIVNYGVGNISSVVNMVKRIGYMASVVSTPSELLGAKRIILPGVGAFDAGMSKLKEYDLIAPLTELAFEQKIPFLGICLGAQLLGKRSEEGHEPGLGWLDFQCSKFIATDKLKVPHMGWNYVERIKKCSLTEKFLEEARFYFVHSYYMDVYDSSQILFKTTYGKEFASGVVKDNIYGVQFHPEKSHKFGMQLMKNFMEIE